MKISVTIDKGRHTINTPHGMKKLLEEMLQKASFEQGAFKVSLGERIRGTGQTKGIRIISFDETTNSITIKVQPGGNDTRHRCVVTLPDMYRKGAVTFYQKLREIYGAGSEIEEEDASTAQTSSSAEPVEKAPMSPAPTLIPKKIVRLDEETIAYILMEIEQNNESKGFLSSRRLFDIIRKLKLEIAENILVGLLLRDSLLEPNPEPGKKESRISQKGYRIIKKYQGKSNDSTNSTEEHTKLEHMQALAEKYVVLNKEIENLSGEIVEIESNISILGEQLTQKKEEVSNLTSQITPEMVKARENFKKIQSLLSEL